ncbi:MAG: hypothetical protein IKP73_16610 [Bacteroidales bacterium]|nr:hypothetical protein [Bacteroidales bacterium]MBR4625343.1 hypothetical protein [Alphaproteobacteria bacterium]
MLQRSSAYYDTAVLLKNSKQYNQSAVYFYYSIFQLMMHLLTIAMRPIPLDRQNILNEDSHKWIMHNIIDRMDNAKREKNLKEDFEFLFEKRHKADYEDRFVSEIECLEAEEVYNRMKRNLLQSFPTK